MGVLGARCQRYLVLPVLLELSTKALRNREPCSMFQIPNQIGICLSRFLRVMFCREACILKADR